MHPVEFQQAVISGLLFLIDHMFYWQMFYLLQGFLITFLLVPIVVIFARKYNLLYKPNNRSSHSSPVPALGGIAIFVGFLITFQLITSITKQQSFTILIATTLIFIVGLIDDLVEIKPWRKLIIVILLSIFITQTQGLTINNLHGFFSIHQLNEFVSMAITVIVITFLINAINLVDGVDGLASGLGITILSIFSLFFYKSNSIQYLSLTIPMIISLAAFLTFNIWGKRYKIFMGDSGSLLLGLIVAISVIHFMQIKNSFVGSVFSISPVTAFALLVIPVFDAFHVTVKRLIIGRSPFKSDKEHIHHTYLKLGFTHRITSLILISYTLVFFFLSQFLLQFLGEGMALIVILILVFLVWNIPERILKRNLRKYTQRRFNYLDKGSFNTSKKK